MAQFDLYEYKGEGAYAFLLELQDNMLDQLSTRVVAPLALADSFGPPMKILNPVIAYMGRDYIVMTHLLAAISSSQLGHQVGTLKNNRQEIIASLDILFTGV